MTYSSQSGSPATHLTGSLARGWRLLIIVPLLCSATAVGITYVLPPTFTARATFMPPQQSSGGIAAALSSLGGLGQLVGTAGGGAIRSPADQYIGLMQSTTVADRLIDQHQLMDVYNERLRTDARRELERRSRFAAGKKDGFVTVEVDDEDPRRAASLANGYVDELRRFTSTLAVSEAQQRRAFFAQQLKDTRDALARAQRALQGSGFDQGTLRAEPKAMADAYARLRAELTTTEVRLQTLRAELSESAPEVRQAVAQASALRSQVQRLESRAAIEATGGRSGEDYIGLYREFKYQETLFELFARQYEIARVDESREGPLVQTIDEATPPERRSRPRRAFVALVTLGVSLFVTAAAVAAYGMWRTSLNRLKGERPSSNSETLA